MSAVRPAAVVVLAAGEGTRMRSATPKVLHAIAGRTLLGHVLAAVAPLEPQHLVVVVGHGREQVVASLPPGAQAVVQEEQNGTGHATRLALDALPDLTDDDVVLVLAGDTPLLTSPTLGPLAALGPGCAAAVLTAVVTDPTGYGRAVTAGDEVVAIVEHKDADAETLAINEVNTGVYAFAAGPLRAALGRLTTDNAQAEEYLTDVIALLRANGQPVRRVLAADAVELAGVNDRAQLAAAAAAMRDRIVQAHLVAGVGIVDPSTTWVDAGVVLEPDCTVLPGSQLHGSTTVASGARVGPYACLKDTSVAAGAVVIASTCDGATIGQDATVGPYAYLRPGAVLERGAKVGAYVEVKESTIGEDSKVPHLSYVGDTTIGRRSNVGAATITVNYDGVAKHRTVVGDDVRIGSDTMLVAPVTIGDGAYTAAGSVITTDVPAGSLAVGRARQRVIDGWVARRRPSAKTPDTSSAGDEQGGTTA